MSENDAEPAAATPEWINQQMQRLIFILAEALTIAANVARTTAQDEAAARKAARMMAAAADIRRKLG